LAEKLESLERLDRISFWALFHCLIRGSAKPEEMERARSALVWAVDNITRLKAVCAGEELHLLGVIWEFWMLHKEAPNLEIIKDLVKKEDVNQTLIEALEDYESVRDSFVRHEAPNLNQLLLEKKEEFLKVQLYLILNTTRIILSGAQEVNKVKLSGPNDAVNYFLNKVNNGMLLDRREAKGGYLKDILKEAQEDYLRNERNNQQGKLIVRTGYNRLDSVIGGLYKDRMVGILGYAKNFKSTLARNIVYNAAEQGFRSIVISLEHSSEEERNIYLILHAHHPKFGDRYPNISLRSYNDGLLTDEEKDFLFGECLTDFETNMPGDICIRQPVNPTWEEIKAICEFENKFSKLDITMVDYLELIKTKSRDRSGEIEDCIVDAKQWAFSFGGGEGTVFITPVQGNREGYAAATEEEGRWRPDGIRQFSVYERTCDLMLNTFVDDHLRSQEQIKIGSCVSRWSEDSPPYLYHCIPKYGKISNLEDSNNIEFKANNSETLDGNIDIL
jgi:hypothetical protein